MSDQIVRQVNHITHAPIVVLQINDRRIREVLFEFDGSTTNPVMEFVFLSIW